MDTVNPTGPLFHQLSDGLTLGTVCVRVCMYTFTRACVCQCFMSTPITKSGLSQAVKKCFEFN